MLVLVAKLFIVVTVRLIIIGIGMFIGFSEFGSVLITVRIFFSVAKVSGFVICGSFFVLISFSS